MRRIAIAIRTISQAALAALVLACLATSAAQAGIQINADSDSLPMDLASAPIYAPAINLPATDRVVASAATDHLTAAIAAGNAVHGSMYRPYEYGGFNSGPFPSNQANIGHALANAHNFSQNLYRELNNEPSTVLVLR